MKTQKYYVWQRGDGRWLAKAEGQMMFISYSTKDRALESVDHEALFYRQDKIEVIHGQPPPPHMEESEPTLNVFIDAL